MKNRAKCKLCGDILESFHHHDFVSCKCGEIFIDGGTAYFRCGTKHPENFLRIDDEGNEIVPKWVEKPSDTDVSDNISSPSLTKQDLVDMLLEMAKSIENLPLQAKSAPVTNADMLALISLVGAIFKTDQA